VNTSVRLVGIRCAVSTMHHLSSSMAQDFTQQADKQKKPPMPRHSLKNKDLTLRTAECSICGPIKISNKNRCLNAVLAEKEKYRRKKGQKKLRPGNQSMNRKYIKDIKSVPCMDCGISYPYYVMDLDHREPSKKYKSVSEMMKHPIEMVIEEAAKCDVVCSNCHRERTWGKNKRPPQAKN